jgi:hypothetical protein
MLMGGIGLTLTGCVLYDHRASSITTRATSLAGFTGLYEDDAFYASKYAWGLGLQAPGQLSHYLRLNTVFLPGTVRAVRISLDRVAPEANDLLVVSVLGATGSLATAIYRPREDFAFVDGEIRFKSKTVAGDRDSPVIGIAHDSECWRVDEQGDLAIISNNAGAGFVTIVPFAMVGHGVARFRRLE